MPILQMKVSVVSSMSHNVPQSGRFFSCDVAYNYLFMDLGLRVLEILT